MNPIQFCVKFNPPTLCLIYEHNREQFFHEFILTAADLALPTKQLVKGLKELNSAYLEKIDSDQIAGLIERIKKEQKKKVEEPKVQSKQDQAKKTNTGSKAPGQLVEKVSSVDKFRKMLGNLGISDSDESSSEEVDYFAVEKSFQNESDSN
jgi:hypothetical protein